MHPNHKPSLDRTTGATWTMGVPDLVTTTDSRVAYTCSKMARHSAVNFDMGMFFMSFVNSLGYGNKTGLTHSPAACSLIAVLISVIGYVLMSFSRGNRPAW